MRHSKVFEYPYDDGTFWFRNFVTSAMLHPFSSGWWLSAILSPLVVLIFSVFWEVVARKWLTIQVRKLKNWFYPKILKKDE